MRTNSREISTVIIANKSWQQTRLFKTKHLSRLKYYSVTLIAMFSLLSGAIFYLNSRNQHEEEEKKQILLQIKQLNSSISINVLRNKKTISAPAYIQTVEVKLQKISNYLRKQGLPGFSTNAVGGNGDAEANKLSDEETYTLYSDYLSQLEHAVAFTPMGYPRNSSITSPFGYRSDPFNSAHAEFHPGIDIKGNKGDEVRCTASGMVVFAGWDGGYGNCIRIRHANSIETIYGHLSHISVKNGQSVTLGQKIGEVGSTGRTTGSHLHYEIRKKGKAINPISFLTLN